MARGDFAKAFEAYRCDCKATGRDALGRADFARCSEYPVYLAKVRGVAPDHGVEQEKIDGVL